MTLFLPSLDILKHYFSQPENVQISILGEGNINDTFLARSPEKNIVLQRINAQVFPFPQRLPHNLQILSQHLNATAKPTSQRWEDVVLIPTLTGKPSVQREGNEFWRALSYIDNSISVTSLQTPQQAAQTGWALGRFHARLDTIDPRDLQTTLPGFHHLSSYLNCYDSLPDTGKYSPEIQNCHELIETKRDTALSLERAVEKGKIKQRIIHGDPKLGNILFDQESGQAVSIIDLDTVGPGLFQHDIGDCLRSICKTDGKADKPADTKFDLDLCKITLDGYFQEAGHLLSQVDRAYIFDGIQAIAFELGLRFFTDYLQGNIYFKCNSPEETLEKALVQFGLFRDICKKEHLIRRIRETR